jgi:hypothetical protein
VNEKDFVNLLIAVIIMVLCILWPSKKPKDDGREAENNTDTAHNERQRAVGLMTNPSGDDADTKEHQAAEQRYWKRQNKLGGAAVFISFLTLGAAVTAGAIAWNAYVISADALRASQDAARSAEDTVIETRKQIVEAKRQANAAEQQVGVQTDTEERQLRAYVIINNNFKKVEGFSAGNKPHVIATLENVGQTPVYDLTWTSGFNVLPFPLTGTISYATCEALLAQPDANRWFFGSSTDIEKYRTTVLSPNDMQPVKNGTSAIYFHGRICYRDIFRKIRRTDFCVRFLGENPTNGDLCERENQAIKARHRAIPHNRPFVTVLSLDTLRMYSPSSASSLT